MGTPVRAIITGATGMVGEGVLLVCLARPEVEAVLVINRKPCGVQHPKLKEIVHSDFYNLSAIESQLSGYNACFFCLGISSVGLSKEDYYKITYQLTMHVAGTLSRHNAGMTFCYISGAGTSESSRQNWSQVKAKTENDLQALPFRASFGIRPGLIRFLPEQKRVPAVYKVLIKLVYPIGRKLFPKGFCTVEEIALAMIHLAQHSFAQKAVEVTDIVRLAQEA